MKWVFYALWRQVPSPHAERRQNSRFCVLGKCVLGKPLYIPLWDNYPRAMRIVAKRTRRSFWDKEPNAEQPLRAWYAVAINANWSSPADVKATYRNSSIIGNQRVVFNIGGNRYRLIVRFDYGIRLGFVRFVGTHAQYDRIDASQV